MSVASIAREHLVVSLGGGRTGSGQRGVRIERQRERYNCLGEVREL